MKGLELARAYYLTYGKPMLEEKFPQVLDRIAVGLAGEGSECLGFDDGFSVDHDFEPGFCLWITGEDEKRFGFALERAYAALPKEFGSFRRQRMAPAGGRRHGVMTVEDFYTRHLGHPGPPREEKEWLYLPSYALLNASNGEVFTDPLGVFSEIRQTIRAGYPADVRRKKMAAHLAMMAQSGQYNYERCLAHGETGAAQLAIFHFVQNALAFLFLLNRAYAPFFKWIYRALSALPLLGDLAPALAALSEMGNSREEAAAKKESIEEMAALFADALRAEGLSDAPGQDLQRHAFAVTEGIRSPTLRGMHILDGV